MVFSIEFSNGNIARAICESTGAVQRTYNSCHNVTKEQGDLREHGSGAEDLQFLP